MFVKAEKCKFKVRTVKFLGLSIGSNSVSINPKKVDGILKWPVPTKVKEVQSFLELANFFHPFIKDFSKIATPLYKLMCKDAVWSWGSAEQKAFDELKQCFIEKLVLSMVDTTKELRVESDASDCATGAVLSMKDDDGKWHPCAYLFKGLNDVEQNYDVHDKELLGVMCALKAWRHYLEGCKHNFEIWTDHRNLQYFMESKKLNRRQA